MIDINDPDMREIVDEFCNESGELLEHLRDTLDKFEDDPESPKLLEEFGQTVDRIMGASKTLGLKILGTFVRWERLLVINVLKLMRDLCVKLREECYLIYVTSLKCFLVISGMERTVMTSILMPLKAAYNG